MLKQIRIQKGKCQSLKIGSFQRNKNNKVHYNPLFKINGDKGSQNKGLKIDLKRGI